MQGWFNSVALEKQDLWCKKKGFVSQRHEGIQNLLTSLLGTNGGMGKKCKLFLSNLADKLFRNNGESYASAISWLETCISFEILRSLHTCLRGSRTPFHKNADFLDDFSVNARNEDILKLTLVCFFLG